MTKVLITGTFDILHPGHLSLFKQAKKLGDFLIVVVARDSTVVKVKGARPLHNQNARVRKIKKIKIADRVVLGRHGDKLKIIELIKPDIIGLGYDQRAFTKNIRAELKTRGLTPRIVRLKAYRPLRYKSSLLRRA
ncbi:MAG: adenylyltransferase/cytidyltransferase family protein [Patescibacteria group bacterium]